MLSKPLRRPEEDHYHAIVFDRVKIFRRYFPHNNLTNVIKKLKPLYTDKEERQKNDIDGDLFKAPENYKRSRDPSLTEYKIRTNAAPEDQKSKSVKLDNPFNTETSGGGHQLDRNN